jgi:hypothetical protein
MATKTRVTSRYSARRGLARWCVFDLKEGKRVSPWMDQLDAMVEASKRNDTERKAAKA